MSRENGHNAVTPLADIDTRRCM